jgi:hypothetical protein
MPERRKQVRLETLNVTFGPALVDKPGAAWRTLRGVIGEHEASIRFDDTTGEVYVRVEMPESELPRIQPGEVQKIGTITMRRLKERKPRKS